MRHAFVRSTAATIFLPAAFAATLALAWTSFGSTATDARSRYVGVKTCARCHDAGGQASAVRLWQMSKHAQAYAGLKAHTESAPRTCGDLEMWIVEHGRGMKYGLPHPAVESKECLPCHVTGFGADPLSVAPSFDPKDGVQCESCHGPGSAHVEAMSAANGAKGATAPASALKHYGDEHAIQAWCVRCHEGTCGDFDFATMWPRIKHATPRGR
ncbi:MAG: hypothetical protein HZC42_03695 [Candidatus Eisenbacteria bacterium]|nr:hypothetical protein [Candidatus Eisenbacteria bacterium]